MKRFCSAESFKKLVGDTATGNEITCSELDITGRLLSGRDFVSDGSLLLESTGERLRLFFLIVLRSVFTQSGNWAYRSLRIEATASMNIFVMGSMALQLSATIFGISLNEATVIHSTRWSENGVRCVVLNIL